jgi:hypothetical protein
MKCDHAVIDNTIVSRGAIALAEDLVSSPFHFLFVASKERMILIGLGFRRLSFDAYER